VKYYNLPRFMKTHMFGDLGRFLTSNDGPFYPFSAARMDHEVHEAPMIGITYV
jgi:hypothetical protein